MSDVSCTTAVTSDDHFSIPQCVTWLARRVDEELRSVIPFDWLCVGITDPVTGLVTMTQNCRPIGPPEVYLATELFIPDFNKIAWLAEQPDPVGLLSEATGGDLTRSYRYSHALEPSGIEHELRAVLVIDGVCWGYLILLRGPDHPDFGPTEVRAVRAEIPRLAADLRARLLAGAQAGPATSEPGVAIVNGDGSLEAANARAKEVFDQIAAMHPAVELDLPVPVAAVVASVWPGWPGGPPAWAGNGECGTTDSGSAPVSEDTTRRVLLVGPDGGWLALSGNRVVGENGESRAVVTVEPASPLVVAALLLQQWGLTEREIAVAKCVLRGLSTAEIADRLAISQYTVQDHLKSVFGKTGVRSRRELARAVLPQDGDVDSS